MQVVFTTLLFLIMFQDFINHAEKQQAGTFLQFVWPSAQQGQQRGLFGLSPHPYLPQASSLYDDPNSLIPTKTDTIDELLTKAQRVSDVIEEGASLALTTNKLLTLNGGKTPEQVAISFMHNDQKRVFKVWKMGGAQLPPIDVNKCRIASTSSSSDKDNATRSARGAAMRRLYKQSNLDEEHYLWVTQNYTYMLPLVTAIIKLIKAERNAIQNDDSITALDLEECQTINKLVAGFGSRQIDFAEYRIGFFNRAIHRTMSLATARKAAINSARTRGVEKSNGNIFGK